MSRGRLQEVLEACKEELFDWSFTAWHHKVLQAIRRCRTSELGGHIDACNCCGRLQLFYNSCRNRHCPRCQSHKREQWIADREDELLETPYYHLVFTLPSELHHASLLHPKKVYKCLFAASWDTVNTFCKNHLQATPGMISILHTWGSNMSLHPHLHCMVPAGGIDEKRHWIPHQKKRRHLFPVKRMSPVFRAKMVALLRKENLPIDQSTYDILFKKNWVVYAKTSFQKTLYVLKYLGRYTHRIAISDGRIQHLDQENKTVTFRVKNYQNEGKLSSLTLTIKEFVKRFQLHILPRGFTRIRHYGLLSSTTKRKYLKPIQEALSKKPIVVAELTPKPEHRICPKCKKGSLQIVAYFGVRGPPRRWLALLEKK